MNSALLGSRLNPMGGTSMKRKQKHGSLPSRSSLCCRKEVCQYVAFPKRAPEKRYQEHIRIQRRAKLILARGLRKLPGGTLYQQYLCLLCGTSLHICEKGKDWGGGNGVWEIGKQYTPELHRTACFMFPSMPLHKVY